MLSRVATSVATCTVSTRDSHRGLRASSVFFFLLFFFFLSIVLCLLLCFPTSLIFSVLPLHSCLPITLISNPCFFSHINNQFSVFDSRSSTFSHTTSERQQLHKSRAFLLFPAKRKNQKHNIFQKLKGN